MKIKKIPEAELEIMLIIWQAHKQINTSEIMAFLNSVQGSQSLQMVQSLLNRLQERGYIECEKIGRFNHYKEKISFEDYRDNTTKNLILKFYNNSPLTLVSSLIESNSLNEKEYEEIQHMLKAWRDDK